MFGKSLDRSVEFEADDFTWINDLAEDAPSDDTRCIEEVDVYLGKQPTFRLITPDETAAILNEQG